MAERQQPAQDLVIGERGGPVIGGRYCGESSLAVQRVERAPADQPICVHLWFNLSPWFSTSKARHAPQMHANDSEGVATGVSRA
jgi:hypothetical protein